tara:strand:- start:683 stop:877 length:195 start_codon:yes stop_codon:yes gene_type:complete
MFKVLKKCRALVNGVKMSFIPGDKLDGSSLDSNALRHLLGGGFIQQVKVIKKPKIKVVKPQEEK